MCWEFRTTEGRKGYRSRAERQPLVTQAIICNVQMRKRNKSTGTSTDLCADKAGIKTEQVRPLWKFSSSDRLHQHTFDHMGTAKWRISNCALRSSRGQRLKTIARSTGFVEVRQTPAYRSGASPAARNPRPHDECGNIKSVHLFTGTNPLSLVEIPLVSSTTNRWGRPVPNCAQLERVGLTFAP